MVLCCTEVYCLKRDVDAWTGHQKKDGCGVGDGVGAHYYVQMGEFRHQPSIGMNSSIGINSVIKCAMFTEFWVSHPRQ